MSLDGYTFTIFGTGDDKRRKSAAEKAADKAELERIRGQQAQLKAQFLEREAKRRSSGVT